jgi:hypothetical protein
MLAGFWRLSVGIMWHVEVMVRGIFIQRPMLRDVVVASVGCVPLLLVLYCQETFCNVPTFTVMTSAISTLLDFWNVE